MVTIDHAQSFSCPGMIQGRCKVASSLCTSPFPRETKRRLRLSDLKPNQASEYRMIEPEQIIASISIYRTNGSTANSVTITCTIVLSSWTSQGYGQVRLSVAGILAPYLRYS